MITNSPTPQQKILIFFYFPLVFFCAEWCLSIIRNKSKHPKTTYLCLQYLFVPCCYFAFALLNNRNRLRRGFRFGSAWMTRVEILEILNINIYNIIIRIFWICYVSFNCSYYYVHKKPSRIYSINPMSAVETPRTRPLLRHQYPARGRPIAQRLAAARAPSANPSRHLGSSGTLNRGDPSGVSVNNTEYLSFSGVEGGRGCQSR